MVDIVKQTIKEMTDLNISATKEASSKKLESFFYYGISGIIHIESDPSSMELIMQTNSNKI